MTGNSGILRGADGLDRCWWCGEDLLLINYHDEEWGRPVIDDSRLFEKITLEGFQAGLSWLTILRKREAFREAFCNFDLEQVAALGHPEVDQLLDNPAIVRNRAKVEATINNAQRCLELIDEVGSLTAYLWSYRPRSETRPRHMDWDTLVSIGTAPEARSLSRDLKRRGWRFVGPTTIYSMMESVGMVNDHVTGCHFHEIVAGEQERVSVPLL